MKSNQVKRGKSTYLIRQRVSRGRLFHEKRVKNQRELLLNTKQPVEIAKDQFNKGD